MSRIQLPESRLRIRKRRRRIRIALVSSVAALLTVAALVGLTYIPFLQISQVQVIGVQTLSSSTIQKFVNERLDSRYGYLVPKRNIFLYPKQELGAALMEKYPVLASADVHAVDFHTIAVALVERTPRALWCSSYGGCLFMDENGVAYAPAPTFSEPIYISYYGTAEGPIPKQFLGPGQFSSLAALVDAISQKLTDEHITKVVVDSHSDVHMYFADGFTLMFSQNDQGGDVFERLSLALTAEPLKSHKLSDLEYLDLRFGDKLYYKLQ